MSQGIESNDTTFEEEKEPMKKAAAVSNESSAPRYTSMDQLANDDLALIMGGGHAHDKSSDLPHD